MRKFSLLILTVICLGFFPQIAGAAAPHITLQTFATGLDYPVDIVNTGVAGDTRLFIVEQAGIIRIVNSAGVVSGTPFLSLEAQVLGGGGGEQGLLGLAFHPDYENNDYFYIYYNTNDGNIRLSRFTVSADPNVADPDSETVIMTISHPTYTNHNGGGLRFGPDGYLYISVGDGGSGGDPNNNAQNLNSYLGKILRINVDSGSPYSSPGDNPFVGVAGLDEIWAYGLRNPWRISFDRSGGDLYIADVGQGAREEVNVQDSTSNGGENYGWRCYEGKAPYNLSGCSGSYVAPVIDYTQDAGRCSITGGYVYRGSDYPDLVGEYVFTDFCSGQIYTLDSGATTAVLRADVDGGLSTFGEDIDGELYVANLNEGKIYKIVSDNYTYVYRYWSDKLQSHFFTANTVEKESVDINYPSTWEYEQVAFQGVGKNNDNTCPTGAPVHRFWSDRLQSHFYTISTTEKDYVQANYASTWTYEGVAYCAFTASAGGINPVYRFWSDSLQTHFYTISQSERDYVNANYGNVWTYEGVAFYAKP
jgi:glucose/arabinose dehydrogenase